MTKPIEPSMKDVAVRYVISSAASRFTVQAFAAGLLSALGHDPVIAIPDFSGEVELADDLAASSVHITIDAASLKVASEIKEKDRREIERVMHEQVLESSQYPEITYECSGVSASQTGEGQYWAALKGELTLHGVTHSQTVSARVTVREETLKAAGSFSILQSDYEIEPVSVVGGTLKLKDELKFVFEIVAKKQG
jgi:polyisoprenoid-binding protein YceI